MQRQMTADQRRAIIVAAGVKIANEHGLTSVKFWPVAEQCEITTSLATVRRYFIHRNDLLRAICQHPDASSRTLQEGKIIGLCA